MIYFVPRKHNCTVLFLPSQDTVSEVRGNFLIILNCKYKTIFATSSLSKRNILRHI